MTPDIFRAHVLANACGLLAKGIQPNSAYTPKNVLATASHITGLRYKRGQFLRAAEDLCAWAAIQQGRIVVYTLDRRAIYVSFVDPPIPVRQFDYAACFDPEHRLQGFGPTPAAAICDLLEQDL